MTATSIASCVRALATGVSQPNAAANMATPRQRHTGTDALDSDAARTARDDDRVRNPIEAINKDDHVCCLGRGAGTSGTHRNANVGRRKRGCIVDSVANHERWMQPLLNCDCFDFIGWHTIGQYSIEIERCTDRLCRIPAVASNHHDARNAGSPQRLYSPGRLTPQLVGQQNCAYRALIDRDKDTQR